MKIDFHILENANQQQALLYTCQLVEKNYPEQMPIYIHAGSRQEADQLDQLLWTYQDDSFLPHALVNSERVETPAILIGYSTPPTDKNLLINLTPQVPAFYKEFKHLIEIVFSDPAMQQLARERYKKYRENGEELSTIKS